MKILGRLVVTALLVFLLGYLVDWLSLKIKSRPDETRGFPGVHLVQQDAPDAAGIGGEHDGMGDELAADWRGALVVTDKSPRSFRLRSSDAAERSFLIEANTIVEVDSKPVLAQELVTGDMATVYLKDGAESAVASRILVRR